MQLSAIQIHEFSHLLLLLILLLYASPPLAPSRLVCGPKFPYQSPYSSMDMIKIGTTYVAISCIVQLRITFSYLLNISQHVHSYHLTNAQRTILLA